MRSLLRPGGVEQQAEPQEPLAQAEDGVDSPHSAGFGLLAPPRLLIVGMYATH
jgi:hypothetical protein